MKNGSSEGTIFCETNTPLTPRVSNALREPFFPSGEPQKMVPSGQPFFTQVNQKKMVSLRAFETRDVGGVLVSQKMVVLRTDTCGSSI